mgnify:CR=1 FL=1
MIFDLAIPPNYYGDKNNHAPQAQRKLRNDPLERQIPRVITVPHFQALIATIHGFIEKTKVHCKESLQQLFNILSNRYVALSSEQPPMEQAKIQGNTFSYKNLSLKILSNMINGNGYYCENKEYQAIDPQANQYYKMTFTRVYSEDDKKAQRDKLERRKKLTLSGRIVRVHEVLELNTTFDGDFLVTIQDCWDCKYEPLELLIQNSVRNWKVVRDLGREISQLLKDLHKEGLKHGDVRPETLFVKSPDGDHGPRVMIKGVEYPINIGANRYKAPEVYENTYTQASDVFSLGCVLISIIHPEFDAAKYKNDREKRKTVKRAVKEFCRTTQPKLREILLSMIDLEPGKRPSAETVREAFNWIDGSPTVSRHVH